MSTHPGPRLAKVMDQEIETAQTLLETLQDETDALGQDPETLQRVASRKQDLVHRMEGLHSQRCTLLQQSGCETSRAGLERFIGRFDHGQRLQIRWRRLVELTERCRDANLSNGAAVELGRLHLRQALAVVHGHSPQTVTYGASGEGQTSGVSRILAKA